MTSGDINLFIWGASAVASWTAGLFFLRFWRDTGDRFFALFCAAFWALSLNWLGLALTDPPDEARTAFYVLRLVAFLLILAAIADKNRSPDE
jgi:hypothetical protein